MHTMYIIMLPSVISSRCHISIIVFLNVFIIFLDYEFLPAALPVGED